MGAGPAGLSLAISLAQAGFTATVLDKTPPQRWSSPPGRAEIALTHPSAATLQRLGHLRAPGPSRMGHIRTAEVDAAPCDALRINCSACPIRGLAGPQAASGPGTPLGFIVLNHALRRTTIRWRPALPGVRIIGRAQVHRVAALATHAEVDFALAAPSPGSPASACAPPWWLRPTSRFSAARRQLGIGAQMTDFGRTVIVCRMRHADAHGDTAHECCGYERYAGLPLLDLRRR